jgi:hypothetical protein
MSNKTKKDNNKEYEFEKKKTKKPKFDDKFDPSRKNKKFYLRESVNEYV